MNVGTKGLNAGDGAAGNPHGVGAFARKGFQKGIRVGHLCARFDPGASGLVVEGLSENGIQAAFTDRPVCHHRRIDEFRPTLGDGGFLGFIVEMQGHRMLIWQVGLYQLKQ